MTVLHEDEIPIDTDLVRRLVARSLPGHADLEVSPLEESGSSNALYRLGDTMLVRLPRQPGGSRSIENEARWLPSIAPALSAAVPEVIAVGEPRFGYPERWSITRWLDGEVAAGKCRREGGAGARFADDLARLVTELHRLDVPPVAAEVLAEA